ncbi:MAG: hypothetical protein HYX72_04545 [Acidobacteria bacterium]|nr:hypothetical protein [Acidobacteriota bacterium]
MWEKVSTALNESASRIVVTVVRQMPGFVALLLSLLLSVIIAVIVRLAIRRMLRGIGLDEWLARSGVADVPELGPANRPTEWVARVLFWLIILAGFLVGLAAFDSTLTSRLMLDLFSYMPDVLAAILIIVAGKIVARYVERSILIGSVNMNINLARPLSLGVKWLVLITTAAMALDHLGIGRRIVYLAYGIVLGGIVLALALAVGLGSKELVSRSIEQQSKQPKREETFHHL